MFGYDDVMNRDDEHPGAVRSTRLTLERFAPSAFWIEQPGTLIIVEGEMDKLACNEVRSLLCVCCVSLLLPAARDASMCNWSRCMRVAAHLICTLGDRKQYSAIRVELHT